jgi:hypothetical protein
MRAKPELIDRRAFASAAQSYSEFALYPPANCMYQEREVLVQLQLIAAQAKIPAGAAYTNRGGPDCVEAESRFRHNIEAGSITPNPLVIALEPAWPWPPTVLPIEAAAGFICRENSRTIVCSRRADDAKFIALGKELEPPGFLPVGKELSVAKQGAGTPFLGVGWSLADEQLRWATGPNTVIIGTVGKPICNTLVFKALVMPMSFGDYFVGSAKLTLNDRDAGEIAVNGSAQQVVQRDILLGGHCINVIKLELHFSKLRSPKELGMNTDTRYVSWLFRWFSVAGS